MISSSNLKLIDVAEPKNLKSTIKGITEKVEEIGVGTVKKINVSKTMTLGDFLTAYGEGQFAIDFGNHTIYFLGIITPTLGLISFEMEGAPSKIRYNGAGYIHDITFATITAENSAYRSDYALKSELGVQVVYDDEGYPCWEDED